MHLQKERNFITNCKHIRRYPKKIKNNFSNTVDIDIVGQDIHIDVSAYIYSMFS